VIGTHIEDTQAALDRAAEAWGPLTCAVLMARPGSPHPLVKVERYDTLVVVRYRWNDGADVIRELGKTTEAHALREYARQIGLAQSRGFRQTATVVRR
jgi:hypothetical protein